MKFYSGFVEFRRSKKVLCLHISLKRSGYLKHSLLTFRSCQTLKRFTTEVAYYIHSARFKSQVLTCNWRRSECYISVLSPFCTQIMSCGWSQNYFKDFRSATVNVASIYSRREIPLMCSNFGYRKVLNPEYPILFGIWESNDGDV